MSVELSTLGEEAMIIMGQSPPGESYNKERKGIPLINGPSEFGTVHPLEVQWTTKPTKFCMPGDLLFCVRGATAGRLNTADKEYCIGRGLAAIRGKTGKFDNVFLRYVLANGYTRFQARGVGSTFINISAEELAQFPVPAISLAQQRRISEILEKADALLTKCRAAIVQLDTLARSIFLDMFGDPISNNMGWATCRLEELATKITDGTHKTPAYKESGVEFLSAKDLKDGGIEWGTGKFISEEEHCGLIKRCNPEIGDLLLAKSGSLGSVAIIDRAHQFSLFESLCLIKHDRAKVDGQYICNLLRVPSMQTHLLGKNKGVAIKHLHLVDVRNLRVPLPPLSLQVEFKRRISVVSQLNARYRLALARLNELFAALQHRAFNGCLIDSLADCLEDTVRSVSIDCH